MPQVDNAGVKRLTNNKSAILGIVVLTAVPSFLALFAAHKIAEPFYYATLAAMVLPVPVWLFLLILKRDESSFLLRTMKALRPLQLLIWIGFVICFLFGLLKDIIEYKGLGFGLTNASFGLGFIRSWIKRQCGIEEPMLAEEWWPAKRD